MPVPSPFVAPPIPSVSLLDFLLAKPAVGYSPDRIIYQDDSSDNHLTFSQVRSAVRTFGNSLKTTCGLEKGDRVVVLAMHGLHIPISLLGVICAGCEAVPTNPSLLASDVEAYIKTTGAKALIVQHLFINVAESLKLKFPDLKIIEISTSTSKRSRAQFDFYSMLAGDEMEWSHGAEEAERNAFICFSSGTGGLPKACPITQGSIVANTFSVYYATKRRKALEKSTVGETVLAAFPPFHVAGIWGSVIFPLYVGNRQILLSAFSMPKFLNLLRQHKPYQLSLAPPIVLALATVPLVDDYDFSSVKMILVGAAPLTKELGDRCVARLSRLGASNLKLVQTWGMTEGVCVLAGYDEEDDESNEYGGVGYPIPHLSIKIVSTAPTESGNEEEVKPGERGEILVKGACIFKGYLGHSESDRAEYFTEDGYYRTGDIGIADSSGRIHIVDRIKELIKVSGYQVAPAELEGLLLTHPDIDDVAVIGVVTTEANGQVVERPRAYLSLSDDSDLSKKHPEMIRKSIHEWYNRRVIGYKRLTGGISLLRKEKGEVVPKSPAGKILRRVLRDQVALEQKSIAKL